MPNSLDNLRAWLTEEPADVITEVAPDDTMYTRGKRWYGRAGQVALESVRLAMLTAQKEQLRSILDFGCGYGRTLRTFRAAFPDASLTACDVNREAVDFCARTFGATGVYSSTDPSEIEIDSGFDLILSNSFFTHVDHDGWNGFLPFLASLLAPGGLFVFTTGGRGSVRRLRDEPERWVLQWMLADGIREEFIADFDRDGFAHRDSPAFEGWGFTAASPAWICRRLEETTDLLLLGIAETRNVDTFSCQRPADGNGRM